MERLVIFLFFFVSLIQSAPVSNNNASSVPLLLLVSFDGFRWDYPDIYSLPHLDSVRQRGLRVRHIENSFATVTFPSHFTMATGLFEETHGIVANTIYDPTFNEVATKAQLNDTKWWSQNPYTQPIWISNELANDSSQRRSGVIAWPGDTTVINGHIATKTQIYVPNRSFESIVQQIFQWFRAPVDERINFGVIYFDEPDITGHGFGPISSEMNQTLRKIDQDVALLLQLVDQDDYLKNNLNVIITADHGMHEVLSRDLIILEDYIDKTLFDAYGSHAFVNIFVHKKTDIDRLYQNLTVLSKNYEVYKKSQIPDEYHYKFNVRIGDILLVGRVGHDIVLPGEIPYSRNGGDHGYDNRAESMHPIFYAFGPAFRSIKELAAPFRSVDLYPLMSHVLKLPPRQTNGSLENVKHILRDFQPPDSWIEEFRAFGILVLICLIVVVCLATIYSVIACCHSGDTINSESQPISRRYRLLDNQDGSVNNLIASESESEVEQR